MTAAPVDTTSATGADGGDDVTPGTGQALRGRTTVADTVVAKLASMSAREVHEVVSLGGALAGALSGVVARVRGDEHRTAGVDVQVGERRAAIDLSLSVRYPAPVAEVTERVRARVVERIQAVTGLEVMEVNIDVTDLVVGGEAGPERPRVR